MCNNPTHNYNWVSGNTEVIDIRMFAEDMTPQDLEDSTAQLGIKEKMSDTLYTYNEIVDVTGEDLNEFIFNVPDTITDSMLPSEKQIAYYYYAINIIDSNGEKTTVLTGRIKVCRNALS